MTAIGRSLRGMCLATLLLGVSAIKSLAHDPGLSTATVLLLPDKVEASLAFALKDAEQLTELDADHDGKVTQADLTQNEASLKSFASENFLVKLDGQPVKPEVVLCTIDLNDNVSFFLNFPNRQFSRIEIRSKCAALLPMGHRQFLTLQAANGKSLAEQLLSANNDSFSFQPSESSATATTSGNSFLSFLELGIKHILTGYDHLLFLFALLLVTKNWLSSLKIITCFTLAHSITLAVATFNVVQLPSRLTEPLIAASIVYVGLENIIRRDDPQKRWLLTFAFGLIHGFGFASVLRELGVGKNGSGVLLPLFSFNLGVELGQIAIAAMLLPFIWKFRTQPVFVQRWSPACSLLVVMAGGYWLVQRVVS
jgi:hydrogenase/urease accessory protein HupE